jgi:thiol:disulfide interchange protein DsbD
VRVEIEADHRSVAPGEPVWVALVQHIDPGWHTYWVNPGDAGLATVIKWQLPDGFSVDAPAWPTPQVFRSGPVVTYGYEHRAVVLQRLHAPPALPAGPIRLSADLRWLACREACIPESATVSLALDRAATRRGMPDRAAAARIAAARAALPGPAPWQAMLSVRRDTLELTLHGLARDVPATATLHFVPLQWGQVDNAAEQRALRSGDDATLTLARGDLKDASLTSLEGLLLVDRGAANAGPRSYQVRAAAADPAAATEHLIPR